MDNYEKTRVRKQVNRLTRRGLLDGKRIVLFGDSLFSKNIQVCLQEHGFRADSVIDNDPRKIGKFHLGVTVKSPEDALVPFDDNAVILFYSPGFYREMTAQLEKIGYKIRKHIHAFNVKIDDSMHMFAYTTGKFIRGAWWYSKIMRGRSKECKVFIAPYTGTGDIYLTGLFFDEYIVRNDITDYVFAVVSGSCKKAAESFGIKNVVILPHRACDDIINMIRFTGQNANILVLNDGWLGDLLQWLRGFKDLNFEKMFRYFVFGFDDSVPHKLPSSKDRGAEIDTLFEKYGLTKGKTVILSPYANTLFELPDRFWENIAEHCKKHGYVVCTNSAAKSEVPVKDTIPVFFPLELAIEFVNAAGYFIGLRSGLCDIISSSNCTKVVLYEKDSLFYKSSQYDYFSLEKMGLTSNAIEIEYRDDLKNDCLEAIYKTIV